MKANKKENRGGVRTSLTKKIGRPKSEPTRTISFRVPERRYDSIKIVLESALSVYLSSFLK